VNRLIRTTIFLSIALLLMISVAACAQKTPADAARPGQNADGYTDITVDQLAEKLQDKDFTTRSQPTWINYRTRRRRSSFTVAAGP
jgi:hypothetical protein